MVVAGSGPAGLARKGTPSTCTPAIRKSPPPYIDGKASIEHQIEIHVADLLEATISRRDHGAIPLADILVGLRYVMDYRIKGGRQPHLDLPVCKRLAEALLLNCGQRIGGLLRRRLTEDAEMAFLLFGEFLEEVEEFRIAVCDMSVGDLRKRLKLNLRLVDSAPDAPREAALAIIAMLAAASPHFSDWRELVKTDYVAYVQSTVDSFLSAKAADAHMPRRVAPCFPPQALHFDRDVGRICDMFGTSLQSGLDGEHYARYQEYYGANDLPKPNAKSCLQMLFDQVNNFMMLILFVALVVSTIIDWPDPTSGIVLLFVIIANVIIGFSQEYKASRALDSISSLTVPLARVTRWEHENVVPASELVPGDLVTLSEGDAVPADLRLVQVSQLQLVESALTGESVPVTKDTKAIRSTHRRIPLADCRGNAFMSTTVARGSGRGVVVRIGNKTEIGKINKILTDEARFTPETRLQNSLTRLGQVLVIVAVILCLLVAVIGILWGKSVVEMAKVGISLAVSVIPEGLVAVVTATMAIAVSRVARKSVIVRKLSAIETLGSISAVCSDKTGTLTEGQMRVVSLWTSDGCDYDLSLEFSKSLPLEKSLHFSETMLACRICNDASVAKDLDTGKVKKIGDTTEIALLEVANAAGYAECDVVRWPRIAQAPFDSDRKMMTVAIARPDDALDDRALVYSKGALESLLTKCSAYLDPSGTIRPIDDRLVDLAGDAQSRLASKGFRVLGLAYKIVSKTRIAEIATQLGADKVLNFIESELCFTGLVGLVDPPRLGVAGAIADCQRAGVMVCMITGDHLQTATAIASQIGIYDANDPDRCRAVRGCDLDVLGDSLASLNPFPTVFARLSPQNKLTIVQALQGRRECVAMTGDGVNDAPAIRRADVGIAMGIAGTEITKQAADIVLADDNFLTIVRALREGRQVYDNIIKFIIYQLACNFSEIIIVLVAVGINLPCPFSPINILWAHLIAGTPPSMSLGLEPPDQDLLTRPPRPADEGILTRRNTTTIILQGLAMSIITLVVYIISFFQKSSWEAARTNTINPETLLELRSEAFFILNAIEIILALLCRSVTKSAFHLPFFGNPYLLAAVALSLGTLVLGIYTPGLNGILELKPVSGLVWMKLLAAIVMLVISSELVKLALRRADQRALSQFSRASTQEDKL